MHGYSTRENRETPRTPAAEAAGRLVKAMRRKADMYVLAESDGCVVPTKSSNTDGTLV